MLLIQVWETRDHRYLPGARQRAVVMTCQATEGRTGPHFKQGPWWVFPKGTKALRELDRLTQLQAPVGRIGSLARCNPGSGQAGDIGDARRVQIDALERIDKEWDH